MCRYRYDRTKKYSIEVDDGIVVVEGIGFVKALSFMRSAKNSNVRRD